MQEVNLYENVKMKICRMIYEGIYPDGELIPPERKLSDELGVSRVTVRKALKLLEEERIIERIQGSGTRISLQYGPREGDMDTITLVAPAQNAFFSRFIDAFQIKADEGDSLVLFKQKPGNQPLEKCLFQIYEKKLRNVVLWLEDMQLSQEALRKLKGLGMNIVLFDTTFKSSFADAVCLDNKNAVEHLYCRLEEQGCKKIGFVGWDQPQVRSVRAREQAFLSMAPGGMVGRMPWTYRNRLDELPIKRVEEILEGLSGCDGILYSVAELGIPFERKSRELKMEHRAAMIDSLPGAEELGIYSIEQDFYRMSEKIINCLRRQNQEGSAWKAGVYQVKGRNAYESNGN